ncbi:MAG TPA: DUF4115 domain-containing protein [Acidobacteriota bacterium]|nr:DUF4115 domain-containing protein [Acidobacteriota bacterium]
MATVGEILKQKRQEQNLTLHDVSEVTKISTNFLDAIENNAFKKLPRGVFPKMFIRAYARHLGLDDDRLIQLYYEQSAEIETQETPAPEGPRMAPIRQRRGHWTRLLVAVVVMGALLGTIYLVYQSSESGPPLDDATPPEPQRPVVEPAPAPAATDHPATSAADVPAPNGAPSPADSSVQPTSGETPRPPATTEPDPQSLVLALRASAVCWVRVVSEGVPQDFILQPGETFQYSYVKPIVLQVGNAGGVTLFLNGQAARPLGTTGQVMELNLSPSNWRDHLAAPGEP